MQNLSISDFLFRINPIRVFIFMTFIHGFFSLKKTKRENLFLFVALLVGLITEVLSVIFECLVIHMKLLYSISFIIYLSIWLIIITNVYELNGLRKIILSVFITFGLVNLFFIEKTNLNHLTFIVGALIYISLFLYYSYHQLNGEKLSYFTENQYLLLFTPVIFFFGFSFMFGFRNSNVSNVIIFQNVNLYTFMGYFVNVVYYTLANIYIYKERKSSVNHEH